MAIYSFLHEFCFSLDYKLTKEGITFHRHSCSAVSEDNWSVSLRSTQHPLFQIRVTAVNSPKPHTQPFIPHSQQMSLIPLFLERQRWHKLSSHDFLPLCSEFSFPPLHFQKECSSLAKLVISFWKLAIRVTLEFTPTSSIHPLLLQV